MSSFLKLEYKIQLFCTIKQIFGTVLNVKSQPWSRINSEGLSVPVSAGSPLWHSEHPSPASQW